MPGAPVQRGADCFDDIEVSSCGGHTPRLDKEPRWTQKNEVRIGTRELRGKLTRYLRLAREGTTVLVTSRNEVVAEITPPEPEACYPASQER